MPLIRLTGKLQQEIGLKSVDLPEIQASCSPLKEWYAHIFILNRRKQLIFIESATLFSFCVENVSRKDIQKRLKELFIKGLEQALFEESISERVILQILEMCCSELSYAKTSSRRIIGVMNEFIKQHKFGFLYQKQQTNIRDSVNRHMPIRGFPDSSEHDFPIYVFAKVIKKHFSLDFVPSKRKMLKSI